MQGHERFFSTHFAQARDNLMIQLPAARFRRHRALLCDAVGPNAEPLTTDCYWLGDVDARQLLVIISGTHGVEGFAGSAIQQAWLSTALQPPSGVAVLLIHALNPHGFAWQRRVEQTGIDLNRNFSDFAALDDGAHPQHALFENSEYCALANALVPPTLGDQLWRIADALLDDARTTLGPAHFLEVVTAGQYEFPHGLFYGGRAPAQSRRNLQELARDWNVASRERVFVLDLHTGLGDYGYGELVCDHAVDDAAVVWMKQWFGERLALTLAGESCSSPKQGLLDYFWQRLGPQVGFATLEFGTHSSAQLLDTLRYDHCLHAQPRIDWSAEQTLRIKQNLMEHFCPQDIAWRRTVVDQGLSCIQTALTCMAES
jgi:predicted deacylase